MDKFDAYRNILTQPNSHNVGVMKLISEYYPALAKKVFERNPLMEHLALANFSSMDILVYPICNRCEALAAYYDYAKNADGTPMLTIEGKPVGICRCLKCGHDTVNPITFFEYCLMELKKRAPVDIDTSLIFAVDIVAERLITDAKRIYTLQAQKENTNVSIQG